MMNHSGVVNGTNLVYYPIEPFWFILKKVKIMSDRHIGSSYPLRMDPEVRSAAQELAIKNERSLNWQINQLIKVGINCLSNPLESVSKEVQDARVN